MFAYAKAELIWTTWTENEKHNKTMLKHAKNHACAMNALKFIRSLVLKKSQTFETRGIAWGSWCTSMLEMHCYLTDTYWHVLTHPHWWNSSRKAAENGGDKQELRHAMAPHGSHVFMQQEAKQHCHLRTIITHSKTECENSHLHHWTTWHTTSHNSKSKQQKYATIAHTNQVTSYWHFPTDGTAAEM